MGEGWEVEVGAVRGIEEIGRLLVIEALSCGGL